MAMKRALLVIDMLEDFVELGGRLRVPDAGNIVPAIQRELGASRARGDGVVFVCDSHGESDPEFSRMGWPPHAVKGTPGARVVEALAPVAGELLLEKTTYSGFYHTRLEEVLRANGIDTLRLTGCVTNICVLYTAADAAMRGYVVEIVRDAVAGLDPGDHTFALRQMEQVLGCRLV
jgi:nicotinamidase/pyrazinamidase